MLFKLCQNNTEIFAVVQAYRDYYRFEKQHLCEYTKREIPKFIKV